MLHLSQLSSVSMQVIILDIPQETDDFNVKLSRILNTTERIHGWSLWSKL